MHSPSHINQNRSVFAQATLLPSDSLPNILVAKIRAIVSEEAALFSLPGGIYRLALGPPMSAAASNIVLNSSGRLLANSQADECTGAWGFFDFKFEPTLLPLKGKPYNPVFEATKANLQLQNAITTETLGIEPSFQGKGLFKKVLIAVGEVADLSASLVCIDNVLSSRVAAVAQAQNYRSFGHHRVFLVRYPNELTES